MNSLPWRRSQAAPVSYTHLDVYKRQILHGVGLPLVSLLQRDRFNCFKHARAGEIAVVFTMYKENKYEKLYALRTLEKLVKLPLHVDTWLCQVHFVAVLSDL